MGSNIGEEAFVHPKLSGPEQVLVPDVPCCRLGMEYMGGPICQGPKLQLVDIPVKDVVTPGHSSDGDLKAVLGAHGRGEHPCWGVGRELCMVGVLLICPGPLAVPILRLPTAQVPKWLV